MRKILLLSFIVLCLNCDDFEFSEKDQAITDPVFIIDPENQNFGAEGSFCYGFSEPTTGNKATIDIPSEFPELIDPSSFLPPIGNQGK